VILDLDSLRPDLVRSTPYRWGIVEGFVRPEAVAELRSAFPDDGFFPNEGHDGEKGYRHHMRPLLTQGAQQLAPGAPQDGVWERLVAELVDERFRGAMGTMLGGDVGGCGVEASMFRYTAGDFLGAHRDLAAKLASLIVYLNEPGWDRVSGGCLRILRSGDEGDVDTEVGPTPGSAALVVRSSRSWHAVSRIDEGVSAHRIGFQVVLWRPEERSTNWTVDDATGAVTAGQRVYNGSWLQRRRARRRDRASS
jgi:2OG-Fe(II) oxygenase superfamily